MISSGIYSIKVGAVKDTARDVGVGVEADIAFGLVDASGSAIVLPAAVVASREPARRRHRASDERDQKVSHF